MNLPAQQFLQLVTQGCEQLAALGEVCEQERQAIEARSAEQLQAVVKQKQQQLEQIAVNIRARNQLLNTQGHNADDAGLKAFLASLPEDQTQPLQKAWQTLSEQLQTTADLNQRNERIVSRSQKNLSQLLGILQGHSAKTTLYNQTGAKGNYSAQNTLGKA